LRAAGARSRAAARAISSAARSSITTAAAVLNLTAFIAVALALLARQRPLGRRPAANPATIR